MKTIQKIINTFSIRYHYYLIPYILIITIVAISDVYITKLTGTIGQSAVNQQSIQNFITTMSFIIIIKLVFGSIQNYFKKQQNAKIYTKFKNAYTNHLLNIKYNQITKQKSGELLSIFTNDLKSSAELLSDDIPNVLFEFITFIISIIFMALINLQLTCLFIILYPILSFIQVKVSTPIQKQQINVSTTRSTYNHFMLNSLNNATTISAFNLEEYMLEEFSNNYQSYFKEHNKYIKLFLSLIVSSVFLTLFPIIICFLGAALATINGTISIADFIVFTTLANKANEFLGMLSQRLNDIQTKLANSTTSLEIMELEKENTEEIINSSSSLSSSSEILLQDISFIYDTTYLFKDFSLSINKGDKIALIGDSGCGKSTLLKILLSFLEIEKGDIYLTGQHFQSLSKAKIRDLISYVPQTPYLFSSSIKENIILNQEYDQEKLYQVCRDAQILDVILALPNQFETNLNATQNLSGGQLQRIAIARALYKDTPIIFFDEATSALDMQVEAAFLQTFTTSLKDKTILFVTHRNETMKACDQIIDLSNHSSFQSKEEEVII